MAPVLAEGCGRRGLDPVPYLLALAAGSNVGSAATLIGNPQNMLIGQTLGLSFPGYLAAAAVPAALGLFLVWGAMIWLWRGRWRRPTAVPAVESRALDRWQTTKGIAVTSGVVAAFLFAPWPREVVALAGAGILLTSRRMTSRTMLALVDWHLLVLFVGLFVVNRAMLDSGMMASGLRALAGWGLDLTRPLDLFSATAVLSNLVSNVPAVMLLLPAATHPVSGPILALASTLAGNLVLVGSIANLIVVDQAARLGIPISWRTHARAGVPVTLGTLAVAAVWLWLVS
jgi:Na+/H+ antiporter NhaD/arsenite permease-like protein